jgi:hypothetical protein
LFGDRVVLTILDYETEPFTPVGAGIGGVPSGGDISVEWRPGPRGVTSSGGVVTVICNLVVVDPPPSTTSTSVPTTTTSSLPTTTSTTVPQSTTTEVPPPTLIESGDAGYIGEEDDGHKHEGTSLWLLLESAIIGIALGTLTAVALHAVRHRR